jgi:hypothetical protein
VVLVVAMLGIALVSGLLATTPEQREEARQRYIRPIEPAALILAAIIFALLLLPLYCPACRVP